MNEKDSLKEVINYWVEKSDDSLNAAHDELEAGRYSFATNRIYYACFYAVSALLLKEGLKFKKHSGVRAAFHKHFVKSKLISREHGEFYDEIFEARQRGDYIELVGFEKKQVENWLQQVSQFVEAIKLLIKSDFK